MINGSDFRSELPGLASGGGVGRVGPARAESLLAGAVGSWPDWQEPRPLECAGEPGAGETIKANHVSCLSTTVEWDHSIGLSSSARREG